MVTLGYSGTLPRGITSSLLRGPTRAVFPRVKIVQIKKTVRKISLTLVEVINETTLPMMECRAVTAIWHEWKQTIAGLSRHGVICIVANTSCCTWIKKQTRWTHYATFEGIELLGFLRLILKAYGISFLYLFFVDYVVVVVPNFIPFAALHPVPTTPLPQAIATLLSTSVGHTCAFFS